MLCDLVGVRRPTGGKALFASSRIRPLKLGASLGSESKALLVQGAVEPEYCPVELRLSAPLRAKVEGSSFPLVRATGAVIASLPAFVGADKRGGKAVCSGSAADTEVAAGAGAVVVLETEAA